MSAPVDPSLPVKLLAGWETQGGLSSTSVAPSKPVGVLVCWETQWNPSWTSVDPALPAKVLARREPQWGLSSPYVDPASLDAKLAPAIALDRHVTSDGNRHVAHPLSSPLPPQGAPQHTGQAAGAGIHSQHPHTRRHAYAGPYAQNNPPGMVAPCVDTFPKVRRRCGHRCWSPRHLAQPPLATRVADSSAPVRACLRSLQGLRANLQAWN